MLKNLESSCSLVVFQNKKKSKLKLKKNEKIWETRGKKKETTQEISS
jgi:hypothetical protein